ncbi:MAG: uracil-DNA glycosylase [Myxococcota bacterium]|nr:uracil-DNA glycosylase [Myxococcota bacterium]
MILREMLPESWQAVLAEEFDKPYMTALQSFLEAEYASQTIYPPLPEIFTAFQKSTYEGVRVLVFGQDPYHGPGEAHGLSFSVKPGIRVPPSLRNMYKELGTDLSCTKPNNGYLLPWAEQGVMMLNAVLTVRHKSPNSHQKQGWETFTDAVIKTISARDEPVVFILWGGKAKKKLKLVDAERHHVITSAHPSPLSARHGFFGSKPFSRVNTQLGEWGKAPIDWQIPNL